MDPENTLPDAGETEPNDADPAEATAQAAEPAEIVEESESEQKFEHAYTSDPRNEIYSRRSEALKQQQEADQGVFEPMAGPEDPEPEAEPEAAPEKSLAPAEKSVKIKVYGEEREVSESDVIRAGVATLQKDAAADIRMAKAARREAELKREEERILRAAENLRKGLDVNGQPLATNPQPPAQGVAGSRTIDKGMLEGAVKALYSGDTEEATEALQTVFTAMQQAQGTSNQVTPEIVKSVEDAVLANISARQSAERDEQDRLEANRIFREDFREIAENPDAFAMAKGLVASLNDDPQWQSRTRAEIAREVGSRIRKLAGKPGDPLAARRDQKRNLPNAGTAAGRQPAPQPQQFPSNSDYIQQLRANSGSNSVR